MDFLISPTSVAAAAVDGWVDFVSSLIVVEQVSRTPMAAKDLVRGSLVMIEGGGALRRDKGAKDSWMEWVEMIHAFDD